MPSWTPAQRSAIESHAGTVLVSAAAGSGKTAVLVEHVTNLLLDCDHPIDVDHLLIVTFTNAAAAEMRERINHSIAARLLLEPSNQHLLRQQMLLPSAKICTIDNFCISLLRENFHQLSIAQGFKIIESSELDLLKKDALNKTIEQLYESDNSDFLALVECLSTAKNDTALGNYILKLYNYIMAYPFPEQWLDQMVKLYQKPQKLNTTAWCELIEDHVSSALQYCKTLLAQCYKLVSKDAVLAEKLQVLLDADEALVEALIHAKQWDERMEALQSLKFMRVPSIKGYADNPLKLQVVSQRDEVKKCLKSLLLFYCATEDEHQKDMKQLAPIIGMLAKTVKLFSQHLMTAKMEGNGFSFADIEHFAIELLVKEQGNSYEPTELALELRSYYSEILIDEYQDTNRAQDILFESISNKNNLFMVGDVKQSIYRFRQAMPQIFMEKRNSFSEYNGVDFPAQIVLDKNFRSRDEICKYINFIFSLLFSKEVGELDYNHNEMLYAGAKYPTTNATAIGLHILNNPLINATNADEWEAEYLATLIASKIEAKELVESKSMGLHTVDYGDFAILFRSASTHIPNYLSVFKKHGIPVSSEATGDLFETPEISTIVSLLRVLNNPMQDIPLLSVMLSPIFGFTVDEMAQMKIADRRTALYTCVSNYAKKGDNKTQLFFKTMSRLRTYCAIMPTDRAIRKIYDETSYVAIAKSMGQGEQREANLNLLLEYAQDFECSGRTGFSSFIRFLDRLIDSDKKLDSANIQSGSAKAVKFMSIHRSKGLEFPICILAGTNRNYNDQSIKENLLLHPAFGIGIRAHNEALLYQYNTVPYTALKVAIKNAEMSESLRVLYVAMTRAKEQLIMVVTQPNLAKRLQGLASEVMTGQICSFVVGKTTNDADLLLRCALLHPSGVELRGLTECEIPTLQADFPMDIRLIDANSEVPQETQPTQISPPNLTLIKKIEDKLAYQYPFSALANVAAKRNASSLDEVQVDLTCFASTRPSFMECEGLSASQRGTAVHTFMEHCDYMQAKNDIVAEALRLKQIGVLSEQEHATLQIQQLQLFFSSDFATRIFSADKVMREIKFATFVPVNKIYLDLPATQEQVYVQGIADCVFIEEGELVVVDYKTDHVKEEAVLLQRYQKQLKLYCEALQKTYNLPVKECFLYSFYLDEPLQYEFI